MIPTMYDPSTWTDEMLRDGAAGFVPGYETMSREEILAALPEARERFWRPLIEKAFKWIDEYVDSEESA